MKKILIFTLILISSLLLSSPAQALDVTAASGSPQDIQAAVNIVNAAGGGTVYIPAGNFIFNPPMNGKGVTIPPGVNVIGAGMDVTILQETVNSGSSVMFYSTGQIGATAAQGPSVRISGITFQGFVENETVTSNVGISIVKSKDFRIDHCKFLDFAGQAIYTDNNTGGTYMGKIINRGVIDHCSFDNPYKDLWAPHNASSSTWAVWGYGIIVVGDYYTWDPNIGDYFGNYYPALNYGYELVWDGHANVSVPVPQPVYIENCNFSRTRHAIAANGAAYYVARYNYFDKVSPYGQCDAHGASPGTRAIEVYDNVFDLTDQSYSHGQGSAVQPRGGGGVAWNNTVIFANSPPNTIALQLGRDTANATYYVNNFYWWNNTLKYQNGTLITSNFISNPTGYVQDVNYFLRVPNQTQDGFTYTPYTYPHPLTLGETPPPTQYQISGKLTDKSNSPLNATITLLQQGTTSAIATTQTSNGNYSLSVNSGTYDLQYSLINFFIQNFFIKLPSLNITSSLSNPINYITNINNQNVSFTANITNNQIIQTQSPQKPQRILVAGTSITEVSSYSQLTNNTWYYDSTNNRLYIKASVTPTVQKCSDGTIYGQCSSNKPLYCDNGNLINKCTSCGCPSGQSCNATTQQCYTPPQTCSDGTQYSQCSSTKPKYCDNGNLVDKCSVCGCLTGYSCNTSSETCSQIPVTEKTFGNTGIGTTFYGDISWQHGTKFTLSETGTITKISVYLDNLPNPGNTLTGSAIVAIYNDNGQSPSSPNNRLWLGVSTDFTGQSPGWKNWTLSLPLTAGNYWLTVRRDNYACSPKYDAGEVDQTTEGYGMLNPWGTIYARFNTRTSIFATYTPSQ